MADRATNSTGRPTATDDTAELTDGSSAAEVDQGAVKTAAEEAAGDATGASRAVQHLVAEPGARARLNPRYFGVTAD